LVLELWIDQAPPENVSLNKTTVEDFLRCIRDSQVVLCVPTNTDQTKVWKEWSRAFDRTSGPAVIDKYRTAFFQPNVRKERPADARDAIDYLEEEPDQLLRAVLNSGGADFIKNAGQFSKQFGIITSNSNAISIYDRYLLKCTSQLMIADKEPKYNEELKVIEGDFKDIIHALNLILHSIHNGVNQISIFSEMAQWSDFRNEMVQYRLSQWDSKKGEKPTWGKVSENLKPAWKKWLRNARPTMKMAAQLIAENLVLKNRENELVIEIIDCSAEEFHQGMMHDRFIQYSQGHHISSGGFRNVHNSISESENLDEIELQPKTYLAKVIFSGMPVRDRKIIMKKKISPLGLV